MDNIVNKGKRRRDVNHTSLRVKPSSYCILYPPQIREMSARTRINVMKIIANVNSTQTNK